MTTLANTESTTAVDAPHIPEQRLPLTMVVLQADGTELASFMSDAPLRKGYPLTNRTLSQCPQAADRYWVVYSTTMDDQGQPIAFARSF